MNETRWGRIKGQSFAVLALLLFVFGPYGIEQCTTIMEERRLERELRIESMRETIDRLREEQSQ